MFYKPNQSTVVEAVQWTGNNIEEVQKSMAPASPLFSKDNPNLGIRNASGSLEFAQPKDWIVNDGGKMRIVSNDLFKAAFIPAAEIPGVEVSQ